MHLEVDQLTCYPFLRGQPGGLDPLNLVFSGPAVQVNYFPREPGKELLAAVTTFNQLKDVVAENERKLAWKIMHPQGPTYAYVTRRRLTSGLSPALCTCVRIAFSWDEMMQDGCRTFFATSEGVSA